MPSAACRYANRRVILDRIGSPQDHYRTHVKVQPCGDSGEPEAGQEPERLYVDGAADRANLEAYFERGGGVVHLRCRTVEPYQGGDGLRPS